jgi:hypothetical protein
MKLRSGRHVTGTPALLVFSHPDFIDLSDAFAPCLFVIKLVSRDVAATGKKTKTAGNDYLLSIPLVEWAMCFGLDPDLAFNMAIRAGNYEIVKFFLGKCNWLPPTFELSDDMCSDAAGRGHLLVLRCLHDHGCPWAEGTCDAAAFYGHVDCLKYAHEHGCRWDERTCEGAAKNGKLVCLKYALHYGCPSDNFTCSSAAMFGHLDCLKLAHHHECSWDEGTCSAAAENGHLDCLKFARLAGCAWDEQTCAMAALFGKYDCLKYAHDLGCEWSFLTCDSAARGGHLECLKYAHKHGCPWDEDVPSLAALNGHIECLKYAHENGCDWDSSTCWSAAQYGHLACLKFAYENGCKWDEQTCTAAAQNHNFHCLKYARENGCDWDGVVQYHNRQQEDKHLYATMTCTYDQTHFANSADFIKICFRVPQDHKHDDKYECAGLPRGITNIAIHAECPDIQEEPYVWFHVARPTLLQGCSAGESEGFHLSGTTEVTFVPDYVIV